MNNCLGAIMDGYKIFVLPNIIPFITSSNLKEHLLILKKTRLTMYSILYSKRYLLFILNILFDNKL